MTPQPTAPGSVREIEYPDSDGQSLADNTLQCRWIITIKGGLDILFRHDPQVFVAADLLWYPIEGDNKTRIAPDVMVAFGRPKGERGSYRQWVEDGIAPQVVFEVLSPGNRTGAMNVKRLAYERFGVEEYYIYDPDRPDIQGYRRINDRLTPIPNMLGWVSPRLGVTFDWRDGDLCLLDPAGEPFATVVEIYEKGIQASLRAKTAERQTRTAKRQTKSAKQAAETARQEAEAARQAAETARQAAETARQAEDAARQDAEAAKQEKDAALQQVRAEAERAERLAARLRELGLNAE